MEKHNKRKNKVKKEFHYINQVKEVRIKDGKAISLIYNDEINCLSQDDRYTIMPLSFDLQNSDFLLTKEFNYDDYLTEDDKFDFEAEVKYNLLGYFKLPISDIRVLCNAAEYNMERLKNAVDQMTETKTCSDDITESLLLMLYKSNSRSC